MPVKLKVITVGDKTTTGGQVENGAKTVFCQDRPVALIGSKSFCPQCKTIGIVRRTHNFNVLAEDKYICMESDVVECKCPLGSNRLIASPGTFEFVGHDDGMVGYSISGGSANSFLSTSENPPEQHAQAAHKKPQPQKFPEPEKLPDTCACDRDITMAEFKLIATGEPDENTLSHYLDALNLWMPWNGISTCRAKAHFLAQACGETGSFKYMEESGGEKQKYAPYYGRGILMLTHKENYIKYSEYVTTDAENSPETIKLPPDNIISGVWVYTHLLRLNAKTDSDDFNYITARINGGFNGYNSRLSSFNEIVKTLKAEHLNILKSSDGFSFKESAIYNNRVYSQEWGTWHDPNHPKNKGTEKNKEKALEGYQRALDLTPNDKDHEARRVGLINRIKLL